MNIIFKQIIYNWVSLIDCIGSVNERLFKQSETDRFYTLKSKSWIFKLLFKQPKKLPDEGSNETEKIIEW